MKISVAEFSAPVGASVFKFCVHLQVGKVYCVNESKDAKAHLPSFSNFQFFFCHSYKAYEHFTSKFSQQLLALGL